MRLSVGIGDALIRRADIRRDSGGSAGKNVLTRSGAAVEPGMAGSGGLAAVVQVPGIDVLDARRNIVSAPLVVEAHAVRGDVDMVQGVALRRVAVGVDDAARRRKPRILIGCALDVGQ